MAYCTASGRRVLRAVLTMPRVGRWHADLVIDSKEPLSREIELAFGDGRMKFSGTVFRGDVFGDTYHCRIVAGRDGLAKPLPGKYYRGVPLRLPLADLATETGETLSASTDVTVLDGLLPKWARAAGPASHALTALVEHAHASWRFMPNGALWVGKEKWTELDFPHQLLRDDPKDGRFEIASELPYLRPGQVFRGKRISAVVHTVEADRARTEAWIERADGSGDDLLDRLKGSLVSIIRGVMREVAYHKPYPARVVQQDADSTLHLRPDSAVLPGLTGVPIRYGVPGVTARVPPGARCVVEFENGDPQTPVVTGFEPGALLELSLDGGGRPIARKEDLVDGGAIGWAFDPLAKSLTLTYRQPGKAPVPFVSFSTPVANPPVGELELGGVIRTGATRIRV